MNIEKFVYKIRRDSLTEPEDFSLSRVPCGDFFRSTEKFIEDNFTGAIRVSIPENISGNIRIAPKGFAFFVKLLLCQVYGRSVINAHLNFSEDEVTFKVEKVDGLMVVDRLTDVALRSGFSVSENEKFITLSTPVLISDTLSIYAKTTLVYINCYYSVFLT